MSAATSRPTAALGPPLSDRGRRRLPRGWWARLVPAVAVLVTVTHLPYLFRPLWNPDEGFLATQARVLADGGTLYEDVVDRKPPLLPWLYQGAFALFGDDSLWPVRVAALLAHAATALLLAAVARRRLGDGAGMAAGLLYPPVSIGLAPEDTQAATFEVFMLPWTVAAVLLADRRRWTAAGLAVAGAVLTKQTGGAVLLPVLWMLWRHRGPGGAAPGAAASAVPPAPGDGGSAGGGRPTGKLRADDPTGPSAAPSHSRDLGRLAVGLVVPIAVVALGTGPGRFVFWTLTGSGSYASPQGSWPLILGRALGNAAILSVACAGLLVPVVRSLVRRRPVGDGASWVWLSASCVAVATGFQFFGHYCLQLLPPLVLLGVDALRRLPRRRRRPAGAWTALASAAFLGWGLLVPPQGLDHSRAVAAEVRARTAADQRVLVWGMRPEQYWFADRAPAVRHLTAGFLTNFSGGRGNTRVGERHAVPGAWEAFRADIAKHPPALIVDDSRGAPYAPERIPTLRRLLGEHYHRVAEVDGAILYARGPAPR